MYNVALLGSTLLFLAVCFAYLRHPAASVFHPATIYLLFHGFLFVLRPILSRVYNYNYLYIAYDFQPTLWDKITVLLGVNLALVVFVFLSLRIANVPFALSGRPANILDRERLFNPFMFAVLLLAPIGLWSLIDRWNLIATDSLTEVMDMSTGLRINTTDNGYFVQAQYMLAPLAVIFAWLYRFRWWSLLPLLLFVFFRAGTGGRGPFIYALTVFALLYLFEQRRKWPTLRILGLGVMAFALFSVIVQDRGKAIRELFVEDQAQVWELEYDLAPLEQMDFGNLEMFEYLVYATRRAGTYDYFASYLQLFTEPIPRVLWPDKPVGSPIQPIHLFEYGTPWGMTWSLPGAGWYELGYLGILIQTSLFAAFYSLFYRRAARPDASGLLILFYVLLLATTIVGFRDGTFVTVARMSIFYQAPILLMWLVYVLQGRAAPQAFAGGALDALTPAERRRRKAQELTGAA